jgi:16S rRNA (cytosine967-C5)-methyltransferase
MHWHSYLQTSLQLVGQYDGTVPFVHYLKQYFAVNKKHGSRDRKWITHCCYSFFRLGHTLKDADAATRMQAGLFLSERSAELKDVFPESWRAVAAKEIGQRIAWLKQELLSFEPGAIFPWKDRLSDGVDAHTFSTSHLYQPALFLRIRPGAHNRVLEQLQHAGYAFTMLNDNCIALPNTTKVDQLLYLNRDVVVQDLSSQRIMELMRLLPEREKLYVWDCCAASGGKSILAADIFTNMVLTVSDLRSSILHNLKQRFADAGIHRYKTLVTDLSKPDSPRPAEVFDLVICDAPCSGSGTWGRTPEQLYYFREEQIQQYAALQQRILQQVVQQLKKEGYLLYITCSVFAAENEQQVEAFAARNNIQLIQKNLFTGYTQHADTLFAALLQRK